MRSNVKTAKRVGVGLSKAPQMASVLSHQCELWVWSRTPHSVFCFFFLLANAGFLGSSIWAQ